MRCQRCQFENIPGESRCLRCGSILGGQSIAVDVHPPRMAKWKGPLRAAVRGLRFQRVLPQDGIAGLAPAWLKIMSWNAFIALILSLVPGLAHLMQRRFRKIWWLLICWAAFVPAGMYFYGTQLGFALVGLAVVVHAWLAFHSALLREHGDAARRAFDLLVLMFFYGFFYYGIRRTVFGDFVWGYTSLNIPYQNVQYGDCLLARRSLARIAGMPRGALVLVPLESVVGDRVGRSLNPGRMIVQIVGLPGDDVEVADTRFVVNGRPLDDEEYPVPDWLRARQVRGIRVPRDSYFISTAYGVQVGGRAVVDVVAIERASVVRASDVQALAIMRWLPVARRGYLRTGE